MSEKKGIKELKELVIFVAVLANAADKTTRDGLQLADIGDFMNAALKAPEAFDGIADVKLEIADLDMVEMAELKDALAKELDLVDDQLEAIIEKSISAIVSIYGIINDVRALKDATNKTPSQ